MGSARPVIMQGTGVKVFLALGISYGQPFSVLKDENTRSPVLSNMQLKKSGRSAFRGEAISLDTEEELFYIPKSALYDNNMWQTEKLGQSGPSGPSGPSGLSGPSGPSGPFGASGQSWTP